MATVASISLAINGLDYVVTTVDSGNTTQVTLDPADHFVEWMDQVIPFLNKWQIGSYSVYVADIDESLYTINVDSLT